MNEYTKLPKKKKRVENLKNSEDSHLLKRKNYFYLFRIKNH